MSDQISLVFWDWNGTLLDDLDYTRNCLNWLLETCGYPQRYNTAAYREIFGFPIEDYYIKAGFDFSRHSYPVLAKIFMDHYHAGESVCGLAQDVPAVLCALRQSGRRQVILSASRQDHLIEQVSRRGLEGCFDALLGLSDIYGVSKVQAGLDYLTRTGADPAHCVMVGDTTHDAEVAAAMGVRCILCAGGHQSRPRLEAVCDTVIDRLAELPELLEKFGKL